MPMTISGHKHKSVGRKAMGNSDPELNVSAFVNYVQLKPLI